jgi:acyl-CoA oxidase
VGIEKMNADLAYERNVRATVAVERLTHWFDDGRTERRRQLEAMIARDPTHIFSNTDNAYLHRTERHVRALAKHVRLVELCRLIGMGQPPQETATVRGRTTATPSTNAQQQHQPGEIGADADFYLLLAAVADDLPTSLHWIMFVPNIYSLCDEEQQRLWLPQCRDWRVIGCYAQTELGHGSNVRALETTATFVPDKGGDGGCFCIHSPTLTSTKFWPGTLGKTANHAMVIARLIDGQGVDRGVHNFIVPLRSMTDHTLLPGVTTGDVGPKIGYNVMDNGYCRFDHVIIPRRNMAMRFATVDKHGNYSRKHVSNAVSKIAYITMMQVRAYIVHEAGKNLAMACTIAIRYSAVRRQGFDDTKKAIESSSSSTTTVAAAAGDNEPKAKELQILDYKQQQHRLFSMLACSYCFFFTGKKVLQRLLEMERLLVTSCNDNNSDKDDSSNDNHTNTTTATNKPPVVVVTKTVVADIHASSSCLKSFTTMIAADGMEDCRKACGGHGFLQSSGLPELINTYLQNPTVEGDNHMLPQQVVKVLLKLYQAVENNNNDQDGGGGNLSDYKACDSYDLIPALQSIQRSCQPPPTCAAKSPHDLLDLPLLLHAFCHRAARLLAQVATQLQRNVMMNGMTLAQAWNQSLVQMARVSRSYAQFLLLRNFIRGIEDEEEKQQQGSSMLGVAETTVLRDLARLFALYWMEREMGDFLEDGYLSAGEQSEWVRTNVLYLLDVIRPNAVALVDARDFSDFRLKSVLGRYDGNVYEAIMESAQRDPLNQQDPGPGYAEHLKRLIVDGVGVYTPSRL